MSDKVELVGGPFDGQSIDIEEGVDPKGGIVEIESGDMIHQYTIHADRTVTYFGHFSMDEGNPCCCPDCAAKP